MGSSNNGNLWLKSKQENRLSTWELTMTYNFVGRSSMSFARMKVLWDTS